MIDRRIEAAGSRARSILSEVDSKRLVAAAGIAVVPTRHAGSAEAAMAIARELGFPAAVKLASPDATHKSDAVGIRLDLADESAVGAAFDELRSRAAAANPPLRFDGVAVQPMAPMGIELLLGGHRDPTFGPVVGVGLGGVFVELHDDIALRIAPLNEHDATEMLEELRGRRLLDGYRGREAVSRVAIRQAILHLSALMVQMPAILEIDVNPIFAYADGVLAVDARVVLTAHEGIDVVPRSSPQRASIEDAVGADGGRAHTQS